MPRVRTLPEHHEGRLLARAHPPTKRFTPGEQELSLGTGTRQAVLFLPRQCTRDEPVSLMLCLHGAGGNARHRIEPLKPLAELHGLVLVGIDSVGPTWDILQGGYGEDVARIDRALEFAFDHCTIDPHGIAVEGFSDGASYALSLGITNGDLFSCIFAFSPGFMAPYERRGNPHIYITHGVYDPTLPIRCSRDNIVPKLRDIGYEVDYHEFKGFHTVPHWAIERAVETLAA